MATIGELIINIKAGTAAFAGDLSRVKNLSFDTSKQIERSFQIMGTAAVGMLAVFGAAMVEMVNKTTEFEVHVLHLSESAGVTTETMSALSFAAKLVGVDVDQVGLAMERFDKQLLLARQGKGQAIDLMKRLGIDPTQIVTSDEALDQIAKHFGTLGDGVQKTGEAMAAFGRNGANTMIPFLNDYKNGFADVTEKARAMGVVFDNETGESALRFTKNLELVFQQLKGLEMQVQQRMLPAMESFTEGLSKNAGAIHGFMDSVLTALPAMWNLMFPPATIEGLATFTKGIEEAGKAMDPVAMRTKLMDAEFAKAGKEAQRTAQAAAELAEELEKKAAAAAKKLATELETVTKNLNIENATFHKSAMDVELYKLTLDGATYAQRQHVLSLYVTNQGLKDQAAYLKIVADQAKALSMSDLGKTIDEEGKAIEDLNRASQKMPDFIGTFKDLPPAIAPATWAVKDLTAKLEDQIKTYGKSDAELQIMGLDAVGATQQQIDGVIALQRQLAKLQESAQGVGQMWKRVGDTMARDFADMIIAGKSFNAVLQDILKSIVNMLMKQALFGNTQGSTGGGGGLFGLIGGLVGGLFGGAGAGGGILGDAGGGSIGDIFGGAAPVFAASGGHASAGQALIVGEEGPEIFRPDVSGAIIPNGEGDRTGSGSVTINYNIDARGADPGADRRIRQAIQDSQDIAVRRAMAGTHELKLRTG